MTTQVRVRRIVIGAACGGGGVGLLGAALYGVLLGQASMARRAIRPLTVGPPSASGRYQETGRCGDLPAAPARILDDAPARTPDGPLTLALLGDSSMVGYGVEAVEETPGALIGTGLARLSGRPVDVVSAAKVGARSADLAAQVDRVLPYRPTAATILIGGNDVTHRIRPSVAVRQLEQAVRRLVEADVAVVVGTCPDLGTIRPIPQPLRYLARRWSRELAAAQTIVTVEAGGRTVSLGDLLGPEFDSRPAEMFSPDRFHPSAAGYARAVSALLPSIAAALGLGDEAAVEPRSERGEGLCTLPDAAAVAAEAAGTEVAPAEVGGRERGPWGRWAELRHRIRLFGGWPAGGRSTSARESARATAVAG